MNLGGGHRVRAHALLLLSRLDAGTGPIAGAVTPPSDRVAVSFPCSGGVVALALDPLTSQGDPLPEQRV